MTIDAASPEATPETAPDLDEGLKALVHPVRRAILAKLKTPEAWFAGQEQPLSLGVCAGQIERGCPLSQSTVSAHLAALQSTGLITGRRIGQWVFYKRNEAAIEALLSRLRETL